MPGGPWRAGANDRETPTIAAAPEACQSGPERTAIHGTVPGDGPCITFGPRTREERPWSILDHHGATKGHPMGETRVDLFHLLEDLRDAYAGSLEETILSEIIANSLDSGARSIHLACDPVRASLTVTDDGAGMQRRQLARYHDIAASTKTKGQGIGFAGVGIKLGLLISEEVTTETRRAQTHVATRWRLASRHRAPWKWVPPPGGVTTRGTAVSLKLTNALSPLLDPGFVETTLRRHYQTLLERDFEAILAEPYPEGVRITIGDRPLDPEPHPSAERAWLEVRMARKRKPSAVGWLERTPGELAEDRRGIAVSTLGKVIKRGWDWLGVTPTNPERICGLIEVPALAECLTLNKADFVRSGARGATYLAYRKAIQESVARQLAAWGDARDTGEDQRRRATRPVERDLERVLVEMADDYPLLSALVERREGGQRRLPIGVAGAAEARTLVAASLVSRETWLEPGGESPIAGDPESLASMGVEAAETPEQVRPPHSNVALPGSGRERRPARYGLSIQFESRDGDPEIGRLVESTVWVNAAHPAYRRAAASRSEGYHVALAVAMALAPLAAEPAGERAFVGSFLERWGAALDSPLRRGR